MSSDEPSDNVASSTGQNDGDFFDRVFDQPDLARYGCSGCGGLIALGLLGFALYLLSNQPHDPPVASKNPPAPSESAASTASVSTPSYTSAQLSMICRAGIAAEMGRATKIMTAIVDDELAHISYRRPDDKKLWKFDCKVEGNRIVWRAVDAFPGSGPGVWRTRPDDDVLTFTIAGKSVTTNSSDGSSASETHRF